MKTAQFFYDYECPFCKEGYEYLMEEIKGNQQLLKEIEIDWRPMEAHPKAEGNRNHTHLACQSYYIAKELGADMTAFHSAMFRAITDEGRDVTKSETLCEILKGIVDTGKFRAILDSGKYAKQVDENNELAYKKSGVWYVPAFRMDGKKLDAKGGIGIRPKELKNFLKG